MEAVTCMELLKLKAMVKIICNMLLYSSYLAHSFLIETQENTK